MAVPGTAATCPRQVLLKRSRATSQVFHHLDLVMQALTTDVAAFSEMLNLSLEEADLVLQQQSDFSEVCCLRGTG